MECGACYGVASRSFFTKKERLDMLKEYKETLESEAQGVAEKIKELDK